MAKASVPSKESPLEEVLGSSFCKYSVIENKLAALYRNQEKIYAKMEEILTEIMKEK